MSTYFSATQDDDDLASVDVEALVAQSNRVRQRQQHEAHLHHQQQQAASHHRSPASPAPAAPALSRPPSQLASPNTLPSRLPSAHATGGWMASAAAAATVHSPRAAPPSPSPAAAAAVSPQTPASNNIWGHSSASHKPPPPPPPLQPPATYANGHAKENIRPPQQQQQQQQHQPPSLPSSLAQFTASKPPPIAIGAPRTMWQSQAPQPQPPQPTTSQWQQQQPRHPTPQHTTPSQQQHHQPPQPSYQQPQHQQQQQQHQQQQQRAPPQLQQQQQPSPFSTSRRPGPPTQQPQPFSHPLPPSNAFQTPPRAPQPPPAHAYTPAAASSAPAVPPAAAMNIWGNSSVRTTPAPAAASSSFVAAAPAPVVSSFTASALPAPGSSSSSAYRPRAPVVSSSMSLPGQGISARRFAPSSPPRPTQPQPLSLNQLQMSCANYTRAQPQLRSNPLDHEAIGTYHYPEHMSTRMYQREIVWTCLRYNTLVCLPTGTGKTLIGAVVLYNYYRWYPRSKVLFVAPTRPLVLQQQKACCEIMGIPPEHTAVVISGSHDPLARKQLWQSEVSRVIFATPQAIMADVAKGIVPIGQIVCLCVDECHKAQKAYSYVEIVKQLALSQHEFRVLGLSATPGADMRAVKSVFENMRLQRIELRDETDEDLAPYLQTREVEKVLVHVSDSCGEIHAAINDCLRSPLKTIVAAGWGFTQIDPAQLHTMTMQLALNNFLASSFAAQVSTNQKWAIAGEISVCRNLLSARDQLKYGVRQCFKALQDNIIGDEQGKVVDKKQPGQRKAPSQGANNLRQTLKFKTLVGLIQRSLTTLEGELEEDEPIVPTAADPSAAPSVNTERFAARLHALTQHHPKIGKLIEVVSAHFSKLHEKAEWTREPDEEEEPDDDEDAPVGGRGRGAAATSFKGCSSQSNVIVFTEYRESVEEIVAHLNSFGAAAGIRAAAFIGQAGKKGMNQKAQAAVLAQFRSGSLNVIVATCVAEEGLDIGHVDLIVSYDVVGSPLRIIQRFGRTGRKRRGRCLTLVEQGKEEETYDRAWRDKNALISELKKQGKKPWFAPKLVPHLMIPSDITPVETLVQVAPEPKQPASHKRARATKKSTEPKVSELAEDQAPPAAALNAAEAAPSTSVLELEIVPPPEVSASKRRRLNAEASRDLVMLQIDDDQDLAAVAMDLIEADSGTTERTSTPPLHEVRSSSPARKDRSTAAHVAIAPQSTEKPSSALRESKITTMFGKQNQKQAQQDLQLRTRRRDLKQAAALPVPVSWTVSQMFPTSSMSTLSLLPKSMRHLATTYVPRRMGEIRRHVKRPKLPVAPPPTAQVERTMDHPVQVPAPSPFPPLTPDGPAPMELCDNHEEEKHQVSAATSSDLKPTVFAPVAAAIPPAARAVPIPVRSFVPVATSPCSVCHCLVVPSAILRCIACSNAYGCTSCRAPGTQCADCLAAFACSQDEPIFQPSKIATPPRAQPIAFASALAPPIPLPAADGLTFAPAALTATRVSLSVSPRPPASTTTWSTASDYQPAAFSSVREALTSASTTTLPPAIPSPARASVAPSDATHAPPMPPPLHPPATTATALPLPLPCEEDEDDWLSDTPCEPNAQQHQAPSFFASQSQPSASPPPPSHAYGHSNGYAPTPAAPLPTEFQPASSFASFPAAQTAQLAQPMQAQPVQLTRSVHPMLPPRPLLSFASPPATHLPPVQSLGGLPIPAANPSTDDDSDEDVPLNVRAIIRGTPPAFTSLSQRNREQAHRHRQPQTTDIVDLTDD